MTTAKETMWLIVLVTFEGFRMAWEFACTCWRKRWPVYGLLALVAGILILLMSGCYSTPAERVRVEAMPESTPAERKAKDEARQELDDKDAGEEGWWTLGKIAGALLGVGLWVERAQAARKATLALGVTTDHLEEAANMMPQVDREKFQTRMAARQDLEGVRKLIHKVRKKHRAA